MTVDPASLSQNVAPATAIPNEDEDILVARDRQLTLQLVGHNARVLALGPTVDLAQQLKAQGCHIVAIEDGRSARTTLRRYCTAVISSDAARINLGPLLRGRRFDVVLLGQMLQQATDPVTLLRSLLPHLTRGGVLVASVSNFAHASARLALLAGSLRSPTGGLDPQRFYTLDLLVRTLGAAGLVATAIERVPVDPYQDPFTEGMCWDAATVPPAVKLLIDRDPEAQVARYLVTAVRHAERTQAASPIDELVAATAAATLADPRPPRALLDAAEQQALARPELEARQAQRSAELLAEQLEQQLRQIETTLEQRDEQLLAKAEGERLLHERLEQARRDADAALQALGEQLQASQADVLRVRDEAQLAHDQQLEHHARELDAERGRTATAEAALVALQREGGVARATWVGERGLHRARLHDLQLSLAAETALRIEREQQRDRALQERARLAATLQQRQATVIRLDAACACLWQQLVQSEQALQTERANTSTLLAELRGNRSSAARLAAGIDRLWQQLEHGDQALQAERASARARLDEQQRALDLHRQRWARREAELAAEIDVFQAQLDSESLRADYAEVHAASREVEIDALEQRTTRREAELAAEIDVFQAQLDAGLLRADRAETEAADLQRELDEAQDLLSLAEEQLSALDDRRRELEALQLATARELDAARAQADTAGHQLRTRAEEIERLRDAARASAELSQQTEAQRSALERELLERDRELAVLGEQLGQARDELERSTAALRQQLATLDASLAASHQQLDRRDQQLDRLRQQLDRAQAAARDARAMFRTRSARLEADLQRLHSSLLFRLIGGPCDRAKQVLLPAGSRRRAAYERLLALAGEARPMIEVESMTATRHPRQRQRRPQQP